MRRARLDRLEHFLFTRRDLLRAGIGAAGTAALGRVLLPSRARADGPPPTPIQFKPFSQPLPIPPVLGQDASPFATNPAITGSAAYYTVRMRRGLAEIIPGVQTPIAGYNGIYPGPTFVAQPGRTDVVRFVNELGFETSVHQHGGHNPAIYDGYPSDLTKDGQTPFAFKDYQYPNEATGFLETSGPDDNDNPSTAWYHDHALDITGPNVYAGLAGFFPSFDSFEAGLVSRSVLPAAPFDLGLAIQDRRFNADGTLFYNPFEHDGFLGDVLVVNGKAQPFLQVEPRKYRFRLLNGSNARIYMLALSNGAPFLQIGLDAWLLPRAVSQKQLLFGMARRFDVVIDFAPLKGQTFYLVNLIDQQDGRGPGGTSDNPTLSPPGTPLLEFRVGNEVTTRDVPDATIQNGDPLRAHTKILPTEIVTTRRWEFVRSQGAWQINDQFYDPGRIDAHVRLGTAERWILKNGGGGWWHPIHIHLEAHQLVSLNGRAIPPDQWTKRDTTLLGPGDEAEVFIRFRDFDTIQLPIVFHCHNIEHEDMRMMAQFDARRS